MRTPKLAIISLFFVILGCGSTQKSSTTASSDTVAEQLVAFSPINGYWSNPDFAGQFDNLRFVRQSTRVNGEIVCRIEGAGELWSKDGTIPFTVTGRSLGAKLEPKLVFKDREAMGSGTVTRDANGWPRCSLKFSYNGRDYDAELICFGDREAAKQRVLSGDK